MNSDYNAASGIYSISFSEKFGVTTSVLSITTSTSVSALRKFSARKPFKCSIQNSRRIVLKEIPIPAWPTHYSNMLMIYFSYSRLMNMVAYFRNHLSWGLMTNFVAKTHLYRYQIISCIAFPTVLTISVILILSAVPLAVLSLILTVSINVQTVLLVISFLVFVLNCYDV